MSASPRSIDERAEEPDLTDMLAQSAFLTMGVLTKLAAENDLSLTQVRVLAILRDRRLRMSDLVDYLGLEKSTLTGLVARAEKRGLLRRTPNATDGRAVDVFLSEEGLALAERGARDLAGYLSPLINVLSPGERDQLRELLAKMIEPRRT